MADLLSAIPFVESVYLLDCGDQNALPPDLRGQSARYPVLRLAEAEDVLDVAVEMAGALDVVWAKRMRARGGKIVAHACGQPYGALIEASTFDKPSFWSDPTRADVFWILPKDEAFAPMLRTVYRCPVHVAPYLWAPSVLQTSIATMAEHGFSFGYRAGSLAAGARIAVFEPNIAPGKTCLSPMLACDLAARIAPEAIDRLTLYNCLHLENHQTFSAMRRSLTLETSGKIDIGAREYFAKAMAQSNVVVSHQLEWMQNYLYFDALYGGYPLIHNSPLFADVGYYYPDTDLHEAAVQILRAYRRHDAEYESYRARADEMIARHSPIARANIDAYARLLIGLSTNTDTGRSR